MAEPVESPKLEIPEPGGGRPEPLTRASAGCDALARAALSEPAARLAVGLRVVGDRAGIDNDLELADAADGRQVACVLIVESPRLLPAEPRRVIGRETVRSSYDAEVERVANPDHARLERELAKVERRRGHTPSIMTTGEPMADLIGNLAEGVMAGIDKLSRLNEASELREKLAATPAEIERQRRRRYSYELVQVEARRAGLARAGLHDSRAGTIRETVARARETRLFRLGDGRRADDAEADGAVVDLAALSAWERSPPPLRTSIVLAQLLQVGESSTAAVDEMLAGWAAAVDGAAPEPAAPAASSLVRIGSDDAGAGFFVSADRVLTLDRLVKGSDLVRITAADGRSGFAMVERRDRRRGLALLRMPAPATALSMIADGAAPADATLVWPGGPPLGAGGRLVRDDAAQRLLWQPDAPVQPLAGSPALVGGAVVAMVTETRELGSVLLPAADLRAFLAKAP